MDADWYLLRSKPNKELVLWHALTARGFESFYPRLHVRPANPRSRTIRPYFPEHVFLYLPKEQLSTSTFHWMPFARGFVAMDGVAATVPLPLVEAIRRHVDEINTQGVELFSNFKRGDPLTIESGAFAGYESIFDTGLSGVERVRMLLKLLSVREASLELPEA
jgi:transcription termination factor NusG